MWVLRVQIPDASSGAIAISSGGILQPKFDPRRQHWLLERGSVKGRIIDFGSRERMPTVDSFGQLQRRNLQRKIPLLEKKSIFSLKVP